MKATGFKLMRTVLRLLVYLVISAAIAVAALPAQATLPQVVKAGCCAAIKKDAQPTDCGHHSPKPNEDKQCCLMCAFCLAVLTAKTQFVYPPTGEESFATLAVREHVRSHRPPVPPPRA